MPSEMLENDDSLSVGDFIEIPGVPTFGCVMYIDGIMLGEARDKIKVRLQEDPEDEDTLTERILRIGDFTFM